MDHVNNAGSQVSRIELKKDAVPQMVVPGPAVVYGGRLSPDTRWLAYVSSESGRNEVYVRAFAGATGGGRSQVSTGGGEEPKWVA